MAVDYSNSDALRWFGMSQEAFLAWAESAEQAVRILEGQPTDFVAGRLSASLDQQGRVIAVFEEEDARLRLLEGAAEASFIPLVGLDEAASQAAARGAGIAWRVSKRDGESMMLTMDYLPERANAVVVQGIVVAVSGG